MRLCFIFRSNGPAVGELLYLSARRSRDQRLVGATLKVRGGDAGPLIMHLLDDFCHRGGVRGVLVEISPRHVPLACDPLVVLACPSCESPALVECLSSEVNMLPYPLQGCGRFGGIYLRLRDYVPRCRQVRLRNLGFVTQLVW